MAMWTLTNETAECIDAVTAATQHWITRTLVNIYTDTHRHTDTQTYRDTHTHSMPLPQFFTACVEPLNLLQS